MFSFIYIWILFLWRIDDSLVSGHAYNMLSSCGTSLTAGSRIMGYSAVTTGSNSVQVRRGSTLLSSGTNFLAGEVLHVTLTKSAGEYVFEADGGASFSGGGCDNRRSTDNVALLTMPSSATGTVNIWAGFAGSQSQVSITNKFTLVGGSSPPTYEPSKAPTLQQTSITFPITQTLVNVPTATFYAKSTTKQAFFTVVQQTLVTQLPILSAYVSVGTGITGSVSSSSSSSSSSTNPGGGGGGGGDGGSSSISGALLTSPLSPTSTSTSTETTRIPNEDQQTDVHLQAGSAVVSYNVMIILERTTYTTISTLTTALNTTLQSSALLNNLKTADPTTYSALTSLVLTTSATAPVVTVLQTAAPSFLPSQEPTYHPAVPCTTTSHSASYPLPPLNNSCTMSFHSPSHRP